MTYYPTAEGKVRAPSAPHEDFTILTQFAAHKPILLQEAGYPSAAAAGSSEEMQAEFLKHLFAAWNEHTEDITYISIFMQTDFSTKICDDLTGYYEFESAKELFADNICTLGLKDKHGAPKKAWELLTTQIAPTLNPP